MKFRERELQEEVSKAVKEYMDGLIHQRRETGGMAVHQNKLALQGQGLYPKDTAQLLQSLNNPSNKLLKNRSKGHVNKFGSKDQRLRSKSVPLHGGEEGNGLDLHISPAPQKTPFNLYGQDQQQCTLCNPHEEKIEVPDHWIVWRDTLSVKNNNEKRAPSAPPRQRIPTPSPAPRPPSIPPHSMCSRPVTPADQLIRVATPGPDSFVPREPTPVTLPKTPDNVSRPATAKLSRPLTAPPPGTPGPAEYIRQPTPAEFNTSKRGAFTPTVPPPPASEAFKENGSNKSIGLEDWINSSDNYEREVAYKLMKSANGNRAVPSELIRARQRVRGKFADTPSHRPGVTNHREPGSAKNAHPSLETLIYDAVKKALDKHDPRFMMSQSQFPRYDSGRPRAQHMPQMARPKEYVHQSSVFTTANGPFRSSFVIHPDWVSEKKSHRHKSSVNPAMYRSVQDPRYSASVPMYKCN